MFKWLVVGIAALIGAAVVFAAAPAPDDTLRENAACRNR